VANVEASDGRFRFVIEQGDFMNRPSRINIEVKGKPASIDEVRVGGPSVVVAHGEVIF
jgi:predicted PhzF superfamily epimerase YddE/YHI9